MSQASDHFQFFCKRNTNRICILKNCPICPDGYEGRIRIFNSVTMTICEVNIETLPENVQLLMLLLIYYYYYHYYQRKCSYK